MSLFPAFPSSEFGPLFRLLDDYDNHRHNRSGGHIQQTLRTFQPRFDVRETKEAYELHGELPGIDQSNLSIEFADPQTLIIKGRIEREYHGGPDGQQQGQITGEVHDQPQSSHKATVEDDGDESAKSSQQQGKPGQENQQVLKAEDKNQKVERAKYWVSERAVGEFHRSFGFPTRVDQDNVKASLKNGILTVTVPKAPAHQSKRIAIE